MIIHFEHIAHGVSAGENYTGTLETTLSWSGGTRTFRCNYVVGVSTNCGGNGIWPSPEEPFTHTCASFELASYRPGGMGSWSCFVEHG